MCVCVCVCIGGSYPVTCGEEWRRKFSVCVFRVEIERTFRQSAESDIAGFRNVLDTLHVTHMMLESDIEALSEDLIVLKKNHEEVQLLQ